MANVFVNPNLPNYFLDAPEVTSADTARSFVDEYEHAKVITFPNVSASIDHDFWADLDTDKYSSLKKFTSVIDADDYRNVDRHARKLSDLQVDQGLSRDLCDQFRAIYDALIPLHRAIFPEYSFTSRKVVWRLNRILNENMHVDQYSEEIEPHFARMFVNLDSQPRIWQTSWTADDMVRNLRGKIPPRFLEEKTRGQIWSELSALTFGGDAREWWDDQPRHVAYFAPGDVWIVDSRQVAHQIFYGRRALSIDFLVEKESMKNPDRHYLEIAARYRRENLTQLAS